MLMRAPANGLNLRLGLQQKLNPSPTADRALADDLNLRLGQQVSE